MKVLPNLISTPSVLSHKDDIIRFLQWADKDDFFSNEKCLELLQPLVEKIICAMSDTEKNEIYGGLLRQILAIYRKVNKPYGSESLRMLVESKEIYFLCTLYSFCDESVQEIIKNKIKLWRWKKENNEIAIYERLLINDLIEMDDEIENDIIDSLPQLKEENKGHHPNAYEQAIGSLTNLYLNNKIINLEDVKIGIKQSGIPMYEWLVEVENYDYDKFDISWLGFCSDSLLKSIASFPTAKTGISNMVKRAYLNNNFDKTILQKYFEFFVGD